MEEVQRKTFGKWKLLVVFAICASPLIASYFTYFVVKPQSRTNYGTLIDPRGYPIPSSLGSASLDGKPEPLDTYKGKWIMLFPHDAECGEPCRKILHDMRQLRLAQGKDMDRLERVWLVTDKSPLDTTLMREYDGTHMLRADPSAVNAWLPADNGTIPADHWYLIDPLGNLMMRFPKDADPNKIKRDLAKLLKASRIG
ncbi:SCO family protein [Noviherbaspirillum galbum]|uniref:Cytochrome C oxidase subunit I n=1 Tax=Noviherbaspirillum galbum TaxID=2709383 RepID=A0A6B3SYA9_9BURK|nr:cytochrome C oxidase subunit I [Noviherbaspirillum galbum]NEX64316.1 cytochrome C oxidase subunit I [Noviherbaspirillum galbum]